MLGCNGNGFVKTGVDESNPNINIAKERKLFICQYTPSERFLKLENNEYRIDDVWTEYAWTYKNSKKEIELRRNRDSKKIINFYINIFNLTTNKYEFDDDINLFEVVNLDSITSTGQTRSKLVIGLTEYPIPPDEVIINFKEKKGIKKITFKKVK